MNRSGYTDDGEQWDLIRWRGAVASAIRGKRGQAFLREMLTALEAMPVKALITEDLEDEEGNVCAMGAVGKARGMDLKLIDPEDQYEVAKAFGIPRSLACEIAYENDDRTNWSMMDGKWVHRPKTPERTWERMHKWVKNKIAAGEEGQG